MPDNVKILHLSLKKKWYDLINSGEKKEEYREMTPYWRKRITNIESHLFEINTLIMTGQKIPMKPYTHVHFTLGYPKKDDIERNMTFEIKGIEIREGKEEWGAIPKKNYFVIVLGDKIKMGDC